jgi:hypothetical protein
MPVGAIVSGVIGGVAVIIIVIVVILLRWKKRSTNNTTEKGCLQMQSCQVAACLMSLMEIQDGMS